MKLQYFLPIILTAVLCGCETKATARAQARAAYARGRASAYHQFEEEERTSIRVVGDVKTQEVPWQDGLTLAKVLLAAQYEDGDGPSEIFIDRRGMRIPVVMKAFLKGHDVVLEPGDTVEVNE